MAKPVPKAMREAPRSTERSAAYHQRARAVLPGGVTANLKYFDPYPLVMRRARGARLWDVDGNEYIDYCLSFGPLILGHGHPRVLDAIRGSLEATGTTMFGTPHELEAAYAERLLEIFRRDGRLRFTMSGTEATLNAVRVARAYRRRPRIARFEGHYHGVTDELLVSYAPTREETTSDLASIAGSPGTPEHTRKNVLVLPFNDLAETERRIRRAAEDLACVIMEPIMRSYIPPDPDFLRGVREATEALDLPLVFDEVMSGFRVAFGGAQHAFRVTPDLTCIGKVIGGGLPCGALLGREDLLELVNPRGGQLLHTSTFAGYPASLAAGGATLDELERPGVFDGLLRSADRLRDGIGERLEASAVPARTQGLGSVFTILFTTEAVRNYRDWLRADGAARIEFDGGLLERGIFVRPGKPFYLSTAHDDATLEDTLRAVDAIVRARGSPPSR